jgi:cytidylate kinase
MKNDPYIVTAFLKAKELENWAADGTNPVVTISRQMGAEGEPIAYRTGEILTEMGHGEHPWVVVDKDLGERVIADQHLPKRISRFFSDEQTLSIEEHIEGILGISPRGATMVETMVRTIVQLARIGQVILIGRAAPLITAAFPRAVHVRIIGSFDRRVERIAESKQCSLDEAAHEVRTIDDQRRHFVSSYFHADVADTQHYDMIFNTDRISVEECARLIAQLVSSPDFRKEKARKLQELRHQVLG